MVLEIVDDSECAIMATFWEQKLCNSLEGIAVGDPLGIKGA